jgi:hypothetical protein
MLRDSLMFLQREDIDVKLCLLEADLKFGIETLRQVASSRSLIR